MINRQNLVFSLAIAAICFNLGVASFVHQPDLISYVIKPTIITSSLQESKIRGDYLMVNKNRDLIIYNFSQALPIMNIPHSAMDAADISKKGVLALSRQDGVHLFDLKDQKFLRIIKTEKDTIGEFASYLDYLIIRKWSSECVGIFSMEGNAVNMPCKNYRIDDNVDFFKYDRYYPDRNREYGDSFAYDIKNGMKIYSDVPKLGQVSLVRVKDDTYVYFTATWYDYSHEYKNNKTIKILKIDKKMHKTEIEIYQILNRESCEADDGEQNHDFVVKILKIDNEYIYFLSRDSCGEFVRKFNRLTNDWQDWKMPLNALERVEIYGETNIIAEQKLENSGNIFVNNILWDGQEIGYKKYLDKNLNIIDGKGKIICKLQKDDFFDYLRYCKFTFTNGYLVIEYVRPNNNIDYIIESGKNLGNRIGLTYYNYTVYKIC